MKRTYNYPVWRTQGGGLVREVGGKYIFVEKPLKFHNLNVGDEMPAEWSTLAENGLARQQEWDVIPITEQEMATAGKANCGCVFHAEDGIPCRHDLALIEGGSSPQPT